MRHCGPARVAELVYAVGLNPTVPRGHVGSNPTPGMWPRAVFGAQVRRPGADKILIAMDEAPSAPVEASESTPDRRNVARSLGLLFFLQGSVVELWLYLTDPAGVRLGPLVGVALLAQLIGVWLRGGGLDEGSAWAVRAVIALGTLLVAFGSILTDSPASGFSVFFVWVAPYAVYFGLRHAALQGAFALAALAVTHHVLAERREPARLRRARSCCPPRRSSWCARSSSSWPASSGAPTTTACPPSASAPRPRRAGPRPSASARGARRRWPASGAWPCWRATARCCSTRRRGCSPRPSTSSTARSSSCCPTASACVPSPASAWRTRTSARTSSAWRCASSTTRSRCSCGSGPASGASSRPSLTAVGISLQRRRRDPRAQRRVRDPRRARHPRRHLLQRGGPVAAGRRRPAGLRAGPRALGGRHAPPVAARRADRPAEPRAALRPHRAGLRARRALRVGRRRAAARRRPVQDDQRLPRPPGGRRAARRGRLAPERRGAPVGHRGAPGRRRVRRARARSSTTREAFEIADRIAEVFEPAIHVASGDVFTSASIGIAVARNPTQPATMLREADAAMYRAKERGRGRFELFDEDMRRDAFERLRTESDLRRALDRARVQRPLPADLRRPHAGAHRASRRSCAGSTPRAGSSARSSSSPWPRRPA